MHNGLRAHFGEKWVDLTQIQKHTLLFHQFSVLMEMALSQLVDIAHQQLDG